jgi:hypothetical protein
VVIICLAILDNFVYILVIFYYFVGSLAILGDFILLLTSLDGYYRIFHFGGFSRRMLNDFLQFYIICGNFINFRLFYVIFAKIFYIIFPNFRGDFIIYFLQI